MFGDKWTLKLIDDERDESRQFTLPGRSFARLLTGVGVFGSSLLILGLVFLVRGSPVYQNYQLERQNELLMQELGEMRAQVGELEGELRTLAERDAELRILAGLDPIDDEVLEVGVGGPGEPSLSSGALGELDPETASEAFATSYDLNSLERRARLLRESMDEAADSLAAHRDLLESTPSILPAAGRVSSRFTQSRMHPIHNRALPHEGVDISAVRGTPIMAAAKGRVTFAGRRSGYGLVVEIDHGFGFETLYGHTAEVLVRPGQQVNRGDVIARVGSSGIATSPHLHYEVRVNSRPVNPMNYVITGAVP